MKKLILASLLGACLSVASMSVASTPHSTTPVKHQQTVKVVKATTSAKEQTKTKTECSGHHCPWPWCTHCVKH